MKKNNLKLLLTIFALTGIFLFSCEKEKSETKLKTITDVEGNTYEITEIGNQVWMSENLRTTTYNDSTPILTEKSDEIWANGDSVALYCWYKNDSVNAIEHNYGALYNYNVVKTGKICPKGWHVPSWDDWSELFDYVSENNGDNSKVNSLKAEDGWQYELNGDNKFDFSALPTPCRSIDGEFNSETNNSVIWWKDNGSIVYFTEMNSVWQIDAWPTSGYCIRCIQD